jgi:hypothetical protein
MNIFVTSSCVAVMLLIGALLWCDLRWRKRDLLSWRNLFLVGYFHFVALSGFFMAGSARGAVRRGAITPTTMLLYGIAVPVFLGVFLIASRWGYRRGLLRKLVPTVDLAPSTPGLLGGIGALLGFSLLGAIALRSGYVGLISEQLRSGMAATATGLATYFLLAKRFNPASWAIFLSTVGLSVLIATVGGIGRRDVLGVLIAVPWMWYWASLRYRRARSIAIFVGAGAVAGALFIVLFTTVRFKGVEGATHRPSFGDRIGHLSGVLTDPKVSSRAVEEMLYTDTANITMFIMDNYPENYPYTPGHMLKWILVNPIPRAIYPNKPEALGFVLSRQMRVVANLGPGVIGQGWSEGGALGVLALALFLGVIYGTVDRSLVERAHNPYGVALLAAGSGNVLAMSRGDVGLFCLQAGVAVVGAWVVLLFVKAIVGPVARAFPIVAVSVPVQAQLLTEAYASGEAPDDGSEFPDESDGVPETA